MSAALRLPVIVDDGAAVRPRTRGECQDGERPCPWVSCTEHTVHGLLIREGGDALTDDDLVEALTTLSATCVLDVADDGVGGEDATLQIVGEILGVTRERVRQIEAKALRRVRRVAEDFRADLSEDALPAAPAKPAKPARPARIDWMGEGDDPAETETDTAPAAMGAEETHVKVNVSRGLLTPPAPGARCAVPGCPDAPQAYQPKLPPELRGLCSRHRQRAQLWRADHKDKSAVEALTWLLAHPEPGARSAEHREAEAVAPVTVLEVVHREPVAVLAELDADLDVLEKASAKVSRDAAAHALEEQNAVAARSRSSRNLATAALARVREELERDQAALRDATTAAANLREEIGWLLSQRDSARAEVEALRDELTTARAEADNLRSERAELAVRVESANRTINELVEQLEAAALPPGPELDSPPATLRAPCHRPLARLAALVKALAPARETVAFEIEESSSPNSWRCAVHRGGELLDSWHHDSETPDDAVGVLVQRAEDIARVRIDELRIALEGA